MIIYLATENQGKLGELKALLANPFPQGQVLSVAELSADQRGRYFADETGSTYAENALIKARALAQILNPADRALILAEDSGFEVEALGGKPGVYSARYASDDKARCEKIIHALRETPVEDRRARFVACIALMDTFGNPTLFFGRTDGYVAEGMRGDKGFGYDPIFCLQSRGPTWGELGAAEKNQTSHRAAALKLAVEYLLKVAPHA